MNILEKIVAHKRKEIASSKLKSPIDVLEKSTFFERRTHSMSREVASKNPVGIISEIKRSSPSTGLLTESVDVTALSSGYISAGAAALSILTDQNFFGGSNDDLSTARLINECPILRKDFIISEYQVIEAKSIGADCILLIAACLEPGFLIGGHFMKTANPAKSCQDLISDFQNLT